MSKGPVQVDSPYVSIFEHFRSELDEHHDRRERVLKASKDITALSKKIIFTLHRVKQLGQTISDARVTKEVATYMKSITDLFLGVAADLQGVNAHRYQRNISGGIQEYMEAVLFKHYLEHHTLLTHQEASQTIPAQVMLTHEDYAMGLFDMTGELMKFAITYMATHGNSPSENSTFAILADMQTLRSELELINTGGNGPLAKDFESKLKTTRASVEKVEAGVYSMTVRGKERPPGWTPDVSAPRESDAVESY